MKVVVFSDGHIGEYTEGWIDPTTKLNTRLLDTLGVWDWVLQLAQEEKADAIVFGGDRFRLRRPPFWIRDLADEKIRAISESGIELYLLVGNHDMYDKAGTWDSYNGLRVWKAPVHILNEPTVQLRRDRVCISFLPYGFTDDDVRQLVSKLNDPSGIRPVNILFFHDDVQHSSRYGSGFVATGGLSRSVLDTDVWDLVIGGHVHLRQELPFEHTTGFHIGSPLDRIEDGPQGAKGAWVLDVDGGDVGQEKRIDIRFVASPFPKVVRSEYPSDEWDAFLASAKDNIAVVTARVGLGENRLKIRKQLIEQVRNAGARSAQVTVAGVQTMIDTTPVVGSIDTKLPLGLQFVEWTRQQENVDPQVIQQIAEIVGND